MSGRLVRVRGVHVDIGARDVCANMARADILMGIQIEKHYVCGGRPQHVTCRGHAHRPNPAHPRPRTIWVRDPGIIFDGEHADGTWATTPNPSWTISQTVTRLPALRFELPGHQVRDTPRLRRIRPDSLTDLNGIHTAPYEPGRQSG